MFQSVKLFQLYKVQNDKRKMEQINLTIFQKRAVPLGYEKMIKKDKARVLKKVKKEMKVNLFSQLCINSRKYL